MKLFDKLYLIKIEVKEEYARAKLKIISYK
jgi:hypothetical protein